MHARQLEVLRAGARRDVDDPGALGERDLVPRDHPVDDPLLRRQVVERALVLEPDELLTPDDPVVLGVLLAQSPAAVAQPILRVRLDRRSDVRRQRPRGRRPDDQRLALTVLEREPDVERRMLQLLVVLLAGLLVLGERRAAARTPLCRAMAFVEPAPPVHLLQEPPDVLDVRVGEGEVVVVPVHPAAEAPVLLGDHLGEVGDTLLAAGGELGEPVLLDVALGVQAERLLHLDLDPQPLAVEAVLVALLEAAERLVALEDVLERPAPGVVDAHRAVGGDGAVDEAPLLAARVLLAQAIEDPFLVPPREDLLLERGMVGLAGQR